ncbi:MAG: hypothetical protein ACOYN0_12060 [Phycisphaerales bacterium]
MNRRISALLLSSLAFLTPTALGQLEKHQVYVAPEARNAAIQYWVASSYVTPEVVQLLRDLNWDKVGDSFDPSAMPPEFAAAAGADIESARNQLLLATRMTRCNFECRWEDGIGTLLPHLGKLRNGCRLLRLDARRAAMNGDIARAVEDLLAIRRIAVHTAMEPITISKLVALAVDSTACDETISLAKSGKLTAAQRDKLLADIASTPTDDLFKMSEVFMSERSWALSLIGNDKPSAAKLKANLAALGDFGDQTQDNLDKLKALSDEDLLVEAQSLSAVYDAVERAWRQPDARAALSAIGDEISAGKHGVLAPALAPAFAKMRSSYDNSLAKLAEASAALKSATLAK